MRTIIGIAMLVLSALFLFSYIREVWVTIARPDQLDDLEKVKFMYGDSDEEVGHNGPGARFLLHSFFILVFGVIGWMLATTSS